MLSPRFSRFYCAGRARARARTRTYDETGASLAQRMTKIVSASAFLFAERPMSCAPPRLFKNAARLCQFLHRIRPEILSSPPVVDLEAALRITARAACAALRALRSSRLPRPPPPSPSPLRHFCPAGMPPLFISRLPILRALAR